MIAVDVARFPGMEQILLEAEMAIKVKHDTDVVLVPYYNRCTPIKMVKHICKTLEVALSDVKSKNREHRISHTRIICSYHLRKNYPFLTLAQIAQLIGYYDHTVVLYALRGVGDRRFFKNIDFKQRFEKVATEMEIWLKTSK